MIEKGLFSSYNFVGKIRTKEEQAVPSPEDWKQPCPDPEYTYYTLIDLRNITPPTFPVKAKNGNICYYPPAEKYLSVFF
ncbi:MAG: hypothetical protein D3906_10655 [Candidatus Electrothrix sp. AUS1_2]|nr:hypothetical protein [Candidatus Electrothrix sp. AUS1_2]